MTTTGSWENQELMPQGESLSVQHCAGSKSLPNQTVQSASISAMGVTGVGGGYCGLKFA
jgi:hypothetical protein